MTSFFTTFLNECSGNDGKVEEIADYTDSQFRFQEKAGWIPRNELSVLVFNNKLWTDKIRSLDKLVMISRMPNFINIFIFFNFLLHHCYNHIRVYSKHPFILLFFKYSAISTFPILSRRFIQNIIKSNNCSEVCRRIDRKIIKSVSTRENAIYLEYPEC